MKWKLLWLIAFVLISSVCATATLRADLNGDCRVDMADMAILMSEWMFEGDCDMGLGPELVVNGDFSSETGGWSFLVGTWIISDGALHLLSADLPVFQTLGGLVIGKTYQLNYDLLSYNIENPFSSGIYFTFDGVSGPVHLLDDPSPAHYSADFVYSGTTNDLYFWVEDIGEGSSVNIDNVSVREIVADSDSGFSFDVFSALYDDE